VPRAVAAVAGLGTDAQEEVALDQGARRPGGVGPPPDGDVAHVAKDRLPDGEGLRVPGVVGGVALDLGEGALVHAGGAVQPQRSAEVA